MDTFLSYTTVLIKLLYRWRYIADEPGIAWNNFSFCFMQLWFLWFSLGLKCFHPILIVRIIPPVNLLQSKKLVKYQNCENISLLLQFTL